MIKTWVLLCMLPVVGVLKEAVLPRTKLASRMYDVLQVVGGRPAALFLVCTASLAWLFLA